MGSWRWDEGEGEGEGCGLVRGKWGWEMLGMMGSGRELESEEEGRWGLVLEKREDPQTERGEITHRSGTKTLHKFGGHSGSLSYCGL